MKSFFVIFILAFTFSSYSQEMNVNNESQPEQSFQQIPKYVYCQIVGTGRLFSRKVTIEIDFGEKMQFFGDHRLRDPNTGKLIVFNSMVDALNFMGKRGWEFAQAYVVTIQNQNVYHYLLKKPFLDLDEDEKLEFLKND